MTVPLTRCSRGNGGLQSGDAGTMHETSEPAQTGEQGHTDATTRWGRVTKLTLVVGTLALVAVEPVSAQSTGSAFCDTNMADTIRNLFTLIQFGGPLVGGLVALGATVAIPLFRRADTKKTLKSMRVQGVVWGVIVAPLGTTILTFILTSVVAGGSSCSL